MDRRRPSGRRWPTGCRRWATAPFRVRSKVRPWQGTFADVDRAARVLAEVAAGPGGRAGRRRRVPAPQLGRGRHHLLGGGLPRRGRGAHRPLLRRQGGRLHPRCDLPRRAGDRRPVRPRPTSSPATRRSSPTDPMPLLARGRRDACRPAPERGDGVRRRCSTASRSLDLVAVDPDAPAIVAFTSGTTRNPKGVVHSHRTIGFETRQLNDMFPTGGPPQITGVAGRPLHRHGQRLPGPAAAGAAGQPDRRVGPRRGAAADAEPRISACRAAPPTSSRACSTTPTSPTSTWRSCPSPGWGDRRVPVAVTERATDLGMKVFRSYGSTEHPSITGCSPRRSRGEAAHDRRPRARRASRCVSTSDGEISSRGPDLLRGLHRPRPHRGGVRRRRAGTAPATWACSTTTAT